MRRIVLVCVAAAAALLLAMPIHAQSLEASIMPVETNPIPDWSSHLDECVFVQSCDDCIDLSGMDSYYCKYSFEGVATCCGRNSKPQVNAEDSSSSSTMIVNDSIIGARPTRILQDGPGASALDGWLQAATDVLAGAAEALRHEVERATEIHEQQQQLEQQAETMDGENDGDNDQPLVLEASIMPIEMDPVPAWASSQDQCKRARSCDDCIENQYCKYSRRGRPRCCTPVHMPSMEPVPIPEPAPMPMPMPADEPLVLEASIMPIETDPTPVWANFETDLCMVKRSCDDCNKDSEYCRYNELGQPACCSTNPDVTVTNHVPAEQPVHNHQQVPVWASKDDECSRVRSCGECPLTDNQYCKTTRRGRRRCCVSARQVVAEEEPLVLEASILPIEEISIPAWASQNEMCQVIRSCDSCPTTDSSYCKYTENGQAQCCQPMLGGEQPTLIDPIVNNHAPDHHHAQEGAASIEPIPPQPRPVWAGTAAEQCTRARSCDDCPSVSNEQYCKYDRRGRPKCCRSTLLGGQEDIRMGQAEAAVNIMIEPPVLPVYVEATMTPPMDASMMQNMPTFITSSDIELNRCERTITCDSCPMSHSMCKYSNEGQAYCCMP